MNTPRLFRRLRYFLDRRQQAEDLAAEMEFHRAMLKDHHIHVPDAARRMGNVLRAHEEARSVWIAWWLETLLQDLAYGFRALLRQPGFTATALLALVLGIGLNTTLFTVFNAIALRPWPVRDPGRLVNLLTVRGEAQHLPSDYAGFSIAEYRYIAAKSRTLSGALVDWTEKVTLDRQSQGARTVCHFVSANYFRVIGVDMALGRGFRDDEDLPGAPEAVAVLSYRTWKTRYAGALDIVGRQIRLEDSPFTVVGVAPKEFTGIGPRDYDLWVPVSSMALAFPGVPAFQSVLTNPHHCCSDVAGRLAQGATREQATAELTNLSARFEAQFGQKPHRIIATGTALLERPDSKRVAVLSAVGLLFSAVLAILLVACANVSNLLLARGAARRSEIAVRLSLGAGQARIVRQLLTESLLLAGIAGALGTAVAWILPGLILRQFLRIPDWVNLAPDGIVLAWATGLACLSAVAFGFAPAVSVTRMGVNEAMKHHARAATSRFRLRSVLLGTQVAISVLLLVVAGLMARGLDTAQAHDPGFRVDGVIMATVDLPINQYSGVRGREFADSIEDRLNATMGREAAALSARPPLSQVSGMTSFRFGQSFDMVRLQFVNGAYFDVLSIPVLRGRKFTRADRDRNVLIINEAAGRRYWPNANPVGKTAEVNGKVYDVVGLSRDAELSAIGPVQPIFFFPFRGGTALTIMVRGDEAKWTRALSDVATSAEPRATVDTAPLAAQVEKSLGPVRVAAWISAALGVLALLLSSVGVYGVISYSVEQRRQELGLRMALGARPGEIVRFVLRDNLRPIAGGLAVGLVLSVGAARLLHGYLYGLPQYDPVAYGAVLAILFTAGIVASVVPAGKSARIDPLEALRYE